MVFSMVEVSNEGRRPIEIFLFEVGATSYAYVGDEVSITVDAVVYEPVSGLKRSSIKVSSSGSERSNVVITLPQDNPFVALHNQIIPGKIASVTIRQLHRVDLDPIVIFEGVVSTVEDEDDDASATSKVICRSSDSTGLRKIPRDRFQGLCNVEVYGPECTLVKATFQETGTVDVVSNRDLTVSGITEIAPSDDRWLAGEAAFGEESRTIVRQDGNILTLDFPFRNNPQGSSVTFVPGCRHRIVEDCDAKFSNADNFRGFPGVPTKDPFRTRID